MSKYFEKVVGEKVYLSPIDENDAELYTKWVNDTEVSINLTFFPLVTSLQTEKSVLQKLASSGDNLAIIEKKEHKLIGNCGFFNINDIHRSAEVGIFVGDKNYWGKGYGTEALTLLIDFGFNARNYHSIYLSVYEFNSRAIRSYEKIGFKRVGVRREAIHIGGKKYGVIIMDVLQSEFFEKTKSFDNNLS